MSGNSPFKGKMVLELASVLAGPSVGMFFAELGATVIKVENPATGGDVTRSWKLPSEEPDNSVSAYFSAFNWGKRSIALDFSVTGDKEKLFALIRKTEILLMSFKPGDAEKFGLDSASLFEINPQVIIGEITGYGPKDPRVAFDAILQAETGFMSMNGTPESGPLKMPVALIDVLAAHQLKEGLLLAWIEKQNTGKGKVVSVSLYDAALASLANQAANYLVSGWTPGLIGSAHPNIAPYGDTFSCADGKPILLAVGNDKQFRLLCEVLGLPDIPSSAKFSSNPDRVINRKELNQALQTGFSKRNRDDWVAAFRKMHIPAAPIQNLEDVFSQPSAHHLIIDAGLKGVRTVIFQKHPVNLLPPPAFDQDREFILKNYLGND